MKIWHERIQYAVGQGGFHAAHIAVRHENKYLHFDYVYDCGALRRQRKTEELKRAIALYATKSGRRVIDALVLSHYDQDHINGARELVRRCATRRIYLPYLTRIHLPLLIAADAHNLRRAAIKSLFAMAYAGRLWGVPITRVRRGGRNTIENGGDLPNRPEGGQGNSGGRLTAEWSPWCEGLIEYLLCPCAILIP